MAAAEVVQGRGRESPALMASTSSALLHLVLRRSCAPCGCGDTPSGVNWPVESPTISAFIASFSGRYLSTAYPDTFGVSHALLHHPVRCDIMFTFSMLVFYMQGGKHLTCSDLVNYRSCKSKMSGRTTSIRPAFPLEVLFGSLSL